MPAEEAYGQEKLNWVDELQYEEYLLDMILASPSSNLEIKEQYKQMCIQIEKDQPNVGNQASGSSPHFVLDFPILDVTRTINCVYGPSEMSFLPHPTLLPILKS